MVQFLKSISIKPKEKTGWVSTKKIGLLLYLFRGGLKIWQNPINIETIKHVWSQKYH